MKFSFLIPAVVAVFLLIPAAHAQPEGMNTLDSLGRKQGHWQRFSKDTLKYEGTFENDIPVGEFKYYYPGKKIKSIVQYSEKGRVAATVNYYDNGKLLAEGEYRDQKKHGTWKYYHKSGILNAIENYNKGIAEGQWATYYDNGKPTEILHYESGLKNGECYRFYPDSILSYKGAYVNDKKHGTFYYYKLNRKLHLAANYKDGLEHGFCFYYDEAGLPDKRLTYSNGRIREEEITMKEGMNKTTYVSISKIAYIFYHNGKSTIRLHDGTDHISQRKMDEFENFLNTNHFYRVNSNYYVTARSITNLKAYSQSERQLRLRPQPPGTVFVTERMASGFLSWAGLIKENMELKNTTNDF